MAFELKDGQLFIFKNEDRKPDSNQPTHRGQMKVGDKEYWVSCWIKEGKKGKFFSCSTQEKEQQPAPNKNSSHVVEPGKNFDDDIPF